MRQLKIYIAISAVISTPLFADESKKSTINEELAPVKGDSKASEVRALRAELLVAKTEAQAMKQLDKLLGKYRGTAMEPGLWLRKAELYTRMSKTERFFEVSRDSETVVSMAPQRVKSASSKKYLVMAVGTYDMIQARFPRFDQLDYVIFNNAFTRQQLGEDKRAEKLYRELERRFPESELMPDTHLALGEMLFDRKAFKDALHEFEQIKKYPESRVYPYGLYKVGWTKYNLRDTAGGLKELEAVVAFGKRVEAEGLDAKLDLRSEALTDMVLFFADVEEASKAYSYFKGQAGEATFGGYLLKLSGLYIRHSKHSEHDRVLNDLIRKSGDAPEVPFAYKSLVENYETQRNRESAVASLKKMDEVCEPGSSWTKANVKKPSQAGEKVENTCLDTLIKLSLNYASKWNRMFKKNTAYPHFADASEAAYEIYLKNNPNGTESLETRFAYAELLFSRKKYRAASDHYAIVGFESKDAKIYHDAGYASIVSLEKAVNDKWNDKDEKRFRELADNYVTRNKNGKHVVDIRFKRAFIAYEKGRYDEAAPDFKDLGWSKRDTSFGEKAQMLYLDILNIKKKYTDLKEYSSRLLGTKLSDARQSQFRKIFEEASFAEAQQLEEKGENIMAAEIFEKFAINNKSSKLADKAWWNSLSLFAKEGYILKATDMSQQMAKLFPQSEHAKDALLRAAQGYESMLDLKRAADALMALSVHDVKESRKWVSLAADFYALSGSKDEAQKLYRNMTKSKDLAVSQAAYSKLMALNEIKRGQLNDLKLLNEVAGSQVQPQASVALARIAELQYEGGKFSDAFKTSSKVLEMRKFGASTSSLARARMVQAQILEREFISQSVKSRGDRIAAVLQIKTEKLDKAQAGYQDVVRFGDPVTGLNALKRLASCYGHFVDSIRGLQLIGEYTKEEIAALRKELEDLTLPMEDRRADVLSEAMKLAKKLELRDSGIAEIQTELNKVNMRRTPSQALVLKIPEAWLPKANTSMGGAL